MAQKAHYCCARETSVYAINKSMRARIKYTREKCCARENYAMHAVKICCVHKKMFLCARESNAKAK